MVPIPLFHLEADGIRLVLDLGLGHLHSLGVTREGRRSAPFHRAPWADDPTPPAGFDADAAPHLARISGDFLCAPFAAADVERAPAHGWPANASWRPAGVRSVGGGVTARFELERRVLGARVIKELTLRDGHPFLYQRHVFEGGKGALPVANHAMVRLPEGGQLSVSPKRWAETPEAALEADPARGRSVLAYPARSEDLRAFPQADGDHADLTSYPIDDGHEDFVMLVEAEDSRLGWAATVRAGQGDMVLCLKNPARLPVTLLWYSNGGRRYAPWNGRHRGVLGIEDGCTWSLYGHAASIQPNPLSEGGIPTAVELNPAGSTDVRHVLGAVPVPEGWSKVADVRAAGSSLTVSDVGGRTLTLPFDAAFLAESS